MVTRIMLFVIMLRGLEADNLGNSRLEMRGVNRGI